MRSAMSRTPSCMHTHVISGTGAGGGADMSPSVSMSNETQP